MFHHCVLQTNGQEQEWSYKQTPREKAETNIWGTQVSYCLQHFLTGCDQHTALYYIRHRGSTYSKRGTRVQLTTR